MDTIKTFFSFLWKWIKKIANFTLRYPFAVAATVLIVVGAIFLKGFGANFQIGGLLGKLWGTKKPDVRNVPPEERKDKDGEPIPVGESDDKGFVQAPATKTIKKPGLFSDPDAVVIVEPDGKKKKIPLPKGVKNSSVKEVVEIKPNIYEVKNNDSSNVNTTSLIEMLDSK